MGSPERVRDVAAARAPRWMRSLRRLAVAFLVGSAACSTPIPPLATAPLAPRPAASHAPALALNPGVDLAYRFTVESGSPPSLLVEMAFHDGPGTQELEVTDAQGPVSGASDRVVDLEARTFLGDPLTVRRDAPGRWSVLNPTESATFVSYRIRGADEDLPRADELGFRVLLTNELLYLPFEVGVLRPTSLSRRVTPTFSLSWAGLADAGWTVAGSFDRTERPDELRMHAAYFQRMTFVAGKLDVRRVHAHGSPVVVAMAGLHPEIDRDAITESIRATVEAARRFFGDANARPVLAFVLGVTAKDLIPDDPSGLSTADGFALFLPRNEDVWWSWKHRIAVAHETFHLWNGQLVSSPDHSFAWFLEGFTTFYARRLLVRAGLLRLDEYAADVNRMLEFVGSDPLRNEPNERIRRDFWANRMVRKLSYHRGDALAYYLDRTIRKRSQGAESLDDLMRSLVSKARENRRLIDAAQVAEAIAAKAGPEAAERVRRVVEDGEDPPVMSDSFRECFHGQAVVGFSVTAGFSEISSRARGLVCGVEADGPAYEAGLRDGQTFLGVDSAANGCAVRIRDAEGKEQRIEWAPRRRAFRHLTLRVREGATVAGCPDL